MHILACRIKALSVHAALDNHRTAVVTGFKQPGLYGLLWTICTNYNRSLARKMIATVVTINIDDAAEGCPTAKTRNG